MPKRELMFQKHIIDSYKKAGGYGRKWASDMQVGVPDLVLALPGFGVHLMEVKHRPTWGPNKNYKNPLTSKQMHDCIEFRKAGGKVMGGVITGEKAVGSILWLFPIHLGEIALFEDVSDWYTPGMGYHMEKLLNNWSTRYGWR